MTSRLLAVCAVPAEADALVADLPGAQPHAIGPLEGHRVVTDDVELDVVMAGVGPAAAAAAAAIALTLRAAGAPGGAQYDVVLSAGVAGGFHGAEAVVGGIVVGDLLIAADLGVVAPEGYLDVETLGFGEALGRYSPPAALVAQLADRCRATGIPTAVGTILTLSSFTGTDERAAVLAAAHSPTAEAMEGMGIATAAAPFGVPVLELRTISNGVGDRDREAWELPRALAALTRAGAALAGASWEL